MKNIFKMASFAFVLLFAATSFADSSFLTRFEKRGLPRIKEPRIEVKVLPNGMRLFLLEDHTLPIITMSAILKTGSIYDPPGKVGLAAITGMLMRSGGAGNLSPDGFDKAADDLGLQISASIGQEMGRATLKVLSEDLVKGAGLLFDMLFKPHFDAARLSVARLKIEESLRRDDDDPKALAARNFREQIYGEKSPWARRPDNTTLKNISQGDVREFHSRYFKTNNILFVAAGDFDTKELVLLLTKLTAGAPNGDISFPEVEAVKLEFTPAVKQVVRPTTQSFIRMGELSVKRHNPDKYALFLMSNILGATNFKSRLMEDIRTKRGMAYSVWSDITPGTDYGTFEIGVDTKSTLGSKVIELIRGHVDRLINDGLVSSEELTFARESLLSKLVFEFDSPFKAVDHRAVYLFHGYPEHYWKIYRDNITRVSATDIHRVAKKYLHPDGMKIVIVGPKIEGLK